MKMNLTTLGFLEATQAIQAGELIVGMKDEMKTTTVSPVIHLEIMHGPAQATLATTEMMFMETPAMEEAMKEVEDRIPLMMITPTGIQADHSPIIIVHNKKAMI